MIHIRKTAARSGVQPARAAEICGIQGHALADANGGYWGDDAEAAATCEQAIRALLGEGKEGG